MESLREIQRVELEILIHLQKFCKQSGLRMFLAGGTLLGAVRHQGFIPWDNDVDISMPRPDYEKLICIFDNKMIEQQLPYRLHRVTNDGHYCCPFIKVVDIRTIVIDGQNQKFKGRDMGIFVDIFPIDGLPDKTEKYVNELMQTREESLHIALSFAQFSNLNIQETLRLLYYKTKYRFRDREKLLFEAQDTLRKYDFDSMDYVVSTFGLRGKKEIIEAKCFSDSVDLHFEGLYFTAPVGYLDYLRQMYGDYMKLPPEDQRVVPHDFEVYWLEAKK